MAVVSPILGEERSIKRSPLTWLWLTVLIVFLDQLTKHMISEAFVLRESIPVIEGFFNLTLVHNTGAAFSLLSEAGGWQRWFFIVLTSGISVFILLWLARLPQNRNWLACALALILGGALGNLWDRVALGYVVDFLDVYYSGWHWPAFNVADSAITIGAICLIIDTIWFDQAEITTHPGKGRNS